MSSNCSLRPSFGNDNPSVQGTDDWTNFIKISMEAGSCCWGAGAILQPLPALRSWWRWW